MEMSTEDRQRRDDERDAIRVTLSIPGAPPGWPLKRIAEDAGLSAHRTWLLLKRMVDARSIVQRKHKPDGEPRVWHFYRALPNDPGGRR